MTERNEALEKVVRTIIRDHLDSGVEFIEIADELELQGLFNEENANYVEERVRGTLRWLDQCLG